MIVRGLLLVLLGLIYNGLLKLDLANLRYPSVLGRIGLAYLFAALIVLHGAGWSLLLLAAFYLVIDVWRFRSWSFFFVVIGSNSIFIYLAQVMVNISHTTHFFFGGMLSYSGRMQPFLGALAYLTVEWLLLYLLYRKKIFLRV